MATLVLYPAVSGDDGYSNCKVGGTSVFEAGQNMLAAGLINVNLLYGSFVRFPNVNLSNEISISSAVLKLTGHYDSGGSDTCHLRIYGVIGTATAPTSYAEFLALTKTTAYVEWNNVKSDADVEYNTPDLSTVIQEIINDPSWEPGDALMLVLWTAPSATNYRHFASLDHTGQNPELTISGSYQKTIEDTFGAGDLIMSNANVDIDDGLTLAEILAEKYLMTVPESLLLQESVRGGFIYVVVTESVFQIYEVAPGAAYHKLIAEGLNIADVCDGGMFELIAEALNLSDLITGTAFVITQDSIFMYDRADVGWHKLVPDTFEMTDALGEILSILISEWLTLIDSQVNNWDGQQIVPESLNLYDFTKSIQQFSKTIDESITATDAASYQLMVLVLEHLRFVDLASVVRKSALGIAESMALTDTTSRAFDKAAESILNAVDVSSVIVTFLRSIAESLGIADASSFTKKAVPSINESLVLTETITAMGTLYQVVYDTLAMNVILDLDGETWECYVLNTPKFLPSMYSRFNFNSYCVFEGRAFGANDDGIYELTGSTDAGNTIHTGVILSETDFGSPSQKRFRRGYFGISGTAPVMILETDSGQRQVYTIDTNGKAVASHELKSKSWVLSIADFDTLDSIKLIPVVLTK